MIYILMNNNNYENFKKGKWYKGMNEFSEHFN